MDDAYTTATLDGPRIARNRVRVADEPVRVGPPRAVTPGEPRVDLVREGGVIRAIEVTCGCGERVRVVCDYG